MSPTEKPDYSDTPTGWYTRWRKELDAAHKATEKARQIGIEAEQRYQAELERAEPNEGSQEEWNLWHAGVATQHALLLAQVPQASVTRRYSDAADDPARMAALMLGRLVNAEEEDENPLEDALSQALLDRLLGGVGICRVRFDREMEEIEQVGVDANGQPLPPVELPVPGSERVEVEYIRWDDLRWTSGARTWREVTWVAFPALLSRDELAKRVGKDLAWKVRLDMCEDPDNPSPYDRAKVWEIWDKSTRHVYYFAEGLDRTLGGPEAPEAGRMEDPLGLEGFFPCPRPMLANPTTKRFLPCPDYKLVRGLLNQIDMVQSRLALLEEAVRVAGAYDKNFPELERIVREPGFNTLIPVENFPALSEKGGLRGVLDWFPLEQVVTSMAVLEGRLERLKAQLYEVSGLSDILRGQGQGPGVTFGEQDLKARFASARLQRTRADFARFASDLARLRADVLRRKCTDAALLTQSNFAATPDARGAAAALQLLRSPTLPFRVQVKPEALSAGDFAKQREERAEVVTSLGSFFAAMAPLAQSMPGSTPFLLEILKWSLAGVRGGAEVEGVLDAAIAQAQQAESAPSQPAPPPPDPKVLQEQVRGQNKQAQIQAELQADLARTAAEVQADAAREQNQREQNVQETRDKALVSAQVHALTGGMQR